jgi:hypothetical protein
MVGAGRRTFLAGELLLLSGCVATHNYVITNVPNAVELVDAGCHEIEYVSVKKTKHALRVYGKFIRPAAPGCSGGRVVVDFVQPGRAIVYSEELVVRRQTRARGWAGAAFRGELAHLPANGEVIRITLEDPHCEPPPAQERTESR